MSDWKITLVRVIYLSSYFLSYLISFVLGFILFLIYPILQLFKEENKVDDIDR